MEVGIPIGCKQAGLPFPAAWQASYSKHLAVAAREVVPCLCLGQGVDWVMSSAHNVHSSKAHKDTEEASPNAHPCHTCA